jgi:hypothetical protein
MFGDPPKRIRRFNLARYLKALNVDLARISMVHFLGGRTRATILEGAELRRAADQIQFSFTNSTSGKPRLHFPPGVRVNDTIDKVNNVTVYIDKKPPTWTKRYTFELDGEELEFNEVPYAMTDIRGGTRVYVDGRLATILKRNNLNPKHQVGTFDDGPRWMLKDELARLGVKLDAVKSADLVNLDETIARIPIKGLEPLSFSVLGKSGGQIRLHPRGASTAHEASKLDHRSTPARTFEMSRLVTVILLYARAAPPDLAKR